LRSSGGILSGPGARPFLKRFDIIQVVWQSQREGGEKGGRKDRVEKEMMEGWRKDGGNSRGEDNSSNKGAVIIARVHLHPVHLMNADSEPDGCQPSDQAKQLGLCVHW